MMAFIFVLSTESPFRCYRLWSSVDFGDYGVLRNVSNLQQLGPFYTFPLSIELRNSPRIPLQNPGLVFVLYHRKKITCIEPRLINCQLDTRVCATYVQRCESDTTRLRVINKNSFYGEKVFKSFEVRRIFTHMDTGVVY